MTYEERIQARIRETGSHLCVGLDPREDHIDGPVPDFLKQVVDETAPHAAAFKPNMAYFEAFGPRGYQWLEDIIHYIRGTVPIVLDGKRSDILETQKHYAKAYFENWKVDAVTLNPYMGYDSIEPFLGFEDKGLYLLGVTSNPGAADVQLQPSGEGRVFDRVQAMVDRAADCPASTGLVVGLTNLSIDLLTSIRDVPLLIPGLGAQGGKLEVLKGSGRSAPILVNASRSILYGESGTLASRAQDAADALADILGKA